MAKLVLSRSEAVVDQCFLDAARVTIGRAAGNRIVVDDPAVGDTHAAITAVGHDYILEDVGGGAPLAVNGTPTRRRILQHGDVVELGTYHLRYIDTKASSEIDLERTMLIPGLALEPDHAPQAAGEIPQDLHIPSARPTKSRFPTARVKWMTGGRAGEVEELDRVIATFGDAQDGLAVVTRRPHGFYVTYVEGSKPPRVNGESIGREARHLQHGDVIDIAGIELEFATP